MCTKPESKSKTSCTPTQWTWLYLPKIHLWHVNSNGTVRQRLCNYCRGTNSLIHKCMIDFCTVVFQEELDVLKLQAHSIERYGYDVGVIRIILNDDCVVDPAWWGKWASHVKVIPRNTFGNNWCDNGWVSQQVLKNTRICKAPIPGP
jgi:hypothetical protein